LLISVSEDCRYTVTTIKLEMDKDGIMVAEYWTMLPPKKELEEKIRQLLSEARERIEARKLLEGK